MASALDKLLGQLRTCKNNCVFSYIFYSTFFSSVITRFFYCMKPSGMCLHIYSLPSSANLIPLLTLSVCTLQKFHFHHSVFPRNTGMGTDIFIKLELYWVLAGKKKNQYPTGICLLPKWKRNGPNGTQ